MARLPAAHGAGVSRDGIVVDPPIARRRSRHQHRFRTAGAIRTRCGSTTKHRPASDSRWRATISTLKAFGCTSRPTACDWREAGRSGPCGDRSTFFRNPFRGVWAFSLRADRPGIDSRVTGNTWSRRRFATTPLGSRRAGTWVGADSLDLQRADLQTAPQLYNLDAVAYESVMLGLFTIYRGEHPDREKPNDMCVAFSRDGFHWSRPTLASPSPRVRAAGRLELGQRAIRGRRLPLVGDNCTSTSADDRACRAPHFPARAAPGSPRCGATASRRSPISSLPAPAVRSRPRARTLTTRVVQFSGAHLFINATIPRIRESGRSSISTVACSAARLPQIFAACGSDRRQHTAPALRWSGGSLQALAGTPVRVRFSSSTARRCSPSGSARPQPATAVAISQPAVPGYSRSPMADSWPRPASHLRGAQPEPQRQPEGNERLPDRDGAPSADA